jgi:4-amino-4-deoxy-L-arabinose transferase-like glycosyltransferase
MRFRTGTLRAGRVAERFVAAWNAISARWNPVLVVIFAWVVLAGPLIFFRGYNAHEGLAVAIARTMLETGNWLVPHMYNVRFVESPELQARIIAALSAPFGGVNQITARLPSFLFLLFGCCLIYWLLRKVAASVPAALLGVALFVACPLVMRLYVSVTPDLPLAILLFFAFVLWWSAYAQGTIGFARWLAIGIVLALAAMMKGPQPIGYFALGIGLFVVITRSWRQIPGLVLAGVICILPVALWAIGTYGGRDQSDWAAYMRLAHPRAIFYGPVTALLHTLAETLPAVLAAAVFLISRAFGDKDLAPPRFALALACYAFVAAIFVLFWPFGSVPRYYLPMVPALCVFGGLAYDQMSARRPAIVAPVLVVTAVFLLYALGYAVASPFFPMQFRHDKVQAEQAATLIEAAPGTIYWYGDVALNILPYLPGHILNASLEELSTIPGPAWIITTGDDANTLLARRPGALRVAMPLGERDQWRLLRLGQ